MALNLSFIKTTADRVAIDYCEPEYSLHNKHRVNDVRIRRRNASLLQVY